MRKAEEFVNQEETTSALTKKKIKREDEEDKEGILHQKEKENPKDVAKKG
jgi:hypothetical protein